MDWWPPSHSLRLKFKFNAIQFQFLFRSVRLIYLDTFLSGAFCILKSMKDKTRVQKCKMRDYSHFSNDNFISDLETVNWNALLLSTESLDVNNVFSSFYTKFNKIVNKHAPIKAISNRKAKQLSKPWITRGIQKSIQIKNKLYSTGDAINYKLYRNKICTLTRLSKQQYYSNSFMTTWETWRKYGKE